MKKIRHQKRKPQGPKKGGVKVKPHSRSPRGANTGKPRQQVRSYRRRKPGSKGR